MNTCPTCQSTLHCHGNIVAWITVDGRIILELASPKPTEQRWLELSGNALNWVADIIHQAQQTAKDQPRI